MNHNIPLSTPEDSTPSVHLLILPMLNSLSKVITKIDIVFHVPADLLI